LQNGELIIEFRVRAVRYQSHHDSLPKLNLDSWNARGEASV
jgi:hypothetical protein